MRLVFFGTGEFAVPSLRKLAPHIILAVSQPDRPAGRGHHLRPSPVKDAATELGIPVATPEKARAPEFVAEVAALDPDALVVASYGQILSQALLDSAKRGGINLHGSLLPKYRGAAPIQRAILNGDQETGVTLMQMDRSMDTGDMIAKVSISIEPDETYGEVQLNLAEVASNMIEAWIFRIELGDYPGEAQDNEQATVAPKVEKAEAELRCDRPAQAEYNRFRAFTPTPGPFLHTRLGNLKIAQARLGKSPDAAPGTILAIDDACEVAFADGSLRFLEVQPEGKKRMTGRDFANGSRLKVGDSLI